MAYIKENGYIVNDNIQEYNELLKRKELETKITLLEKNQKEMMNVINKLLKERDEKNIC